jgi:hypothetical protein
MVVTACRHERDIRTMTLSNVEAKHTSVEGQGTIKIGDLKMNMSNPGGRGY